MIIVCERYALLPNDKKAMIAGELDRSVREIERKVSVSSEISIPLGFAKTVIGYADKGCLLMCHYLVHCRFVLILQGEAGLSGDFSL
jgi:hypothetical protein